MVVTIQLKYYWRRTAADNEEIQVPLTEGAMLKDLKRKLAEIAPELYPEVAYAVYTVNGRLADDHAALNDGSVVAIMTPMKGG